MCTCQFWCLWHLNRGLEGCNKQCRRHAVGHRSYEDMVLFARSLRCSIRVAAVGLAPPCVGERNCEQTVQSGKNRGEFVPAGKLGAAIQSWSGGVLCCLVCVNSIGSTRLSECLTEINLLGLLYILCANVSHDLIGVTTSASRT